MKPSPCAGDIVVSSGVAYWRIYGTTLGTSFSWMLSRPAASTVSSFATLNAGNRARGGLPAHAVAPASRSLRLILSYTVNYQEWLDDMSTVMGRQRVPSQ
jgi:hypothetical protein